jgi:hypothetical protein
MDIDAIHQWSADPALVALDNGEAAGAFFAIVAVIAAGAGIHAVCNFRSK